MTESAHMKARLAHLERRQRLEEVAERFRMIIEAPSPGEPGWTSGRLPFSAIKVRLGGRPVTPSILARRAGEMGLACDPEGLTFDFTRSHSDIEAEEDALSAFFATLLEADPEAFLGMPRRGVNVPDEATLPESKRWLERFYGQDFLPREKKPAVIDLGRSQGPWMRSVDPDPLQIIDAASQIASLAAGIRPGPVQAALDEGRFDPHMVSALPGDDPAARAEAMSFLTTLRQAAPPGLSHVAWVNGGAEANEKAFHIARVNGPGGHRILAFEGSFHGRTLLSLFSTWNPVKRAPYQLKGHETCFLPYPLALDGGGEALIPDGWLSSWSTREADRAALVATAEGDALLTQEIEVLAETERQIALGDVMAVVIEPYQCEGGDRPTSIRFMQGLRAVTRAWGVPLIFDEVQTGFGLAGPVFWNSLFWLVDQHGHIDGPDLIVCAKRAQVGLVLSRWPDPAPAPFHSASLVRGHVHLDLVQPALTHSRLAQRRLHGLVERWPGIVSHPRVYGDAFAFDLPSKDIALKLIAQRFYRGYMVYIAGAHTLRYRLNRSMSADDVGSIFDIIDQSIAALVEMAGGPGDDLVARMEAVEVPTWSGPVKRPVKALPGLEALLETGDVVLADRILRAEGELSAADRRAGSEQLGLSPEASRGSPALDAARSADPAAFAKAVGVELRRWLADAVGTRIRRIEPADFEQHVPEIMALQVEAYEPERRDSPVYFQTVGHLADGVFLLAEDPEGVVGISFAGPLELWWAVDGPREDPEMGRQTTLYSADITVAARARGRGVGYRLRVAQMATALALRHPDGRPRYAWITGRNRLGSADAMWDINRSLGGYEVRQLTRQYGQTDAVARYYRIPLRRYDRRPFATPEVPGPHPLDVRHGISMPTGRAHPALVRARAMGTFDEAACTKLTLSNFITRPYARYAEYLRHLHPRGCPHMYFTSSRDEMVDKSIRVMKHNRPEGQVVIGLSAGELGGVTAAARSLSLDGAVGGAERFGFFDWPLLPHPADGLERTLDALEREVERHGADGIIGLVVESVQRRTGRPLSAEAWSALCKFRDRTGVPLALVETTTGMGRSGQGTWWLDGVTGQPDLVLWWAGGQIGHIFVSDRCYVAKPLTFISTWDGDELSATRLLRQLYLTREAPVAPLAHRLERGLAEAGFGPGVIGGMGLYRTLRVGAERASDLQHALSREGIRLGRPDHDVLAICPPITVSEAELDRLIHALTRASRALP